MNGRLSLILLSSLVVAAACGSADPVPRNVAARADTLAPVDPEQAVRRTVRVFGARMQTVPLLAPDSIAASRVQEAYGALVTPDLLSDWMARPTAAPGRRVSTSWPDRIEVQQVQPAGVDEYLVVGTLIFESSAPGRSTSRVATRPVRLHVRRTSDGTWRISVFEQPAGGVSPS